MFMAVFIVESSPHMMVVWRAHHAVAHVGYGDAVGMIVPLTAGNHVSMPRFVYSDANSDAESNSYANSDARYNLDTGHNYRFQFHSWTLMV